jgi:hypothetical protein
MHPKSPKWLQDIADACAVIRRATHDQDLATYEQVQKLLNEIDSAP